MTTTAYEDAIADASTEITALLGDSWPVVLTSVVGLLAFKYFRRFAR